MLRCLQYVLICPKKIVERAPERDCLVLRGEQMLGSRPRSECPAYPGWCCRNHGVRVAGQRGHPQSPTRDGAGVRGAARGRRSVPWARVRPCFDCTRSLLRDQTDEVGTHLCTRVRERFARSCTSSEGVEINLASHQLIDSHNTELVRCNSQHTHTLLVVLRT